MATRGRGLTRGGEALGRGPVMSYEEALRYLYSFTNYETRAAPRGAFKLTRMERLLELAERPERRYPSVLVAGTKGKGSTAAMLAAIAQAAGKRVGFYSSPHLNTHRERYRLQGVPISKDVFVHQVEQLPGLLAELERRWPDLGSVTLFELCTLLAFRWFAAEAVDLAVVEVGVGGRLDCTNVLRPQLSLIAPISYDHRDVLGNTLTEIAFEKAGIIKPGHLVLSAPQTAEAAAVLRRVAAEQSAPLRFVPPGEPVGAPLGIVAGQPLPARLGQWFRPHGWPADAEPCWLSLLGEHQLANAAVALEAAAELGFDEAATRQGLAEVRWPGRLEVLRAQPLVVGDGAQNGASMERLIEAVRRHFRYRRLRLVLGFSADKEIPAMARVLNPVADEIILTRSRHPRAASPAALLAHFPAGYVTASLEEALALVDARACPDELTLVTGSLFPVAGARFLYGLVPPDEQDPLD